MGRHPSRRHVAPEEAPVGRRIRQRRRELGITQAELAGAEYTKSFISQLEGGHADPSLDTLRFLGRRLHMGLSTMAGDAADQRLSMLTGLVAWAEDAARGGRVDAARRAIDIVREIAAEGGADLHAAEALLLLADLELRAGRPDRAQAALDEAARLPLPLTSRAGTRIDLTAGRLALYRGDAGAAASSFRRALGGPRRVVRHPDLGVQALLGMAAAAARSGEHRQARRRLQSAVALAERHGLDAWCGRALVRLALAHRLEARWEEAAAALSQAARLLRDTQDPRGRLEVALAQGLLALERGGPENPTSLLQEARDISARLGDHRAQFAAAVGLTRAALVEARVESAAVLSDDVRTLAEALDDGVARARADALAGRVLAARGRHAEASDLLGGAIAALRLTEFSDELAEAATAAGESARAGGEPELAERYLALAAEARQVRPAALWPIELPF